MSGEYPEDDRPETYTLEEVEELVRAAWAAAETVWDSDRIPSGHPTTADEWVWDWRSGVVWGGE